MSTIAVSTNSTGRAQQGAPGRTPEGQGKATTMPEPNESQPTPQQPLNPDLMGYPSVEALVAAKRASDAEGKRLFDENQKKDLLLSQMLQNGLEGTPRQSVPDRRS